MNLTQPDAPAFALGNIAGSPGSTLVAMAVILEQTVAKPLPTSSIGWTIWGVTLVAALVACIGK